MMIAEMMNLRLPA